MQLATLFAVVLVGIAAGDGAEAVRIKSLPIANFKATSPGIRLPDRDRARAKALFAGQRGVGARAESVPLNNTATVYTLDVGVGSPPTNYTLLIDTGSAYTWLGAGKPYVETATSKNQGKTFSIRYGSGSASGDTWQDLVTFSPSLSATSSSLGVASSSKGLDKVDGILGLGPTDLNQGVVEGGETVPTIMDDLFAGGQISSNLFGLSFVPTTSRSALDGELTFGDTDPSKYVGDLTWFPITTTSPANQYWGYDQTIQYGNTIIQESSAGIVDSGTTLLLISEAAFKSYQDSLPGSKIDEATGLLEIPEETVNQMQSMFFNVGGESFEFTADAQIWPRFLNGDIGGKADSYYSVISTLPDAEAGMNFINGFVFMQRFYTAHDASNSRIGFASTESTLASVNLRVSL